MRHWIFTQFEKENIGAWETKVVDNSFSKKLLNPFWEFVVQFVPSTVAPNVLSLGGLLCIMHASYLCFQHLTETTTIRNTVSLTSLGLIFSYLTLSAITTKHAKNTQNDSPIVELFLHSCHLIGTVFLVLTLSDLLRIDDLRIKWYFSQSLQLLFLRQHIMAFKEKTLKFRLLAAPGEVIFLCIVVIVVKSTVGWSWARSFYEKNIVTLFTETLPFIPWSHNWQIIANEANNLALAPPESVIIWEWVYNIMLFVVFCNVITLPRVSSSTSYLGSLKNIFFLDSVSINGLLFCLAYRAFPVLSFTFLGFNLFDNSTILGVICDSLFMAMVKFFPDSVSTIIMCCKYQTVTTDIIASKMAKRDLHPWIVIAAMISLLNEFVILVMFVAYYMILFYEISEFLHIPIFVSDIVVYTDGVFDMCHIGHYNMFQNAAAHGTKLIVGVMSDESVSSYKRAPIMTLKERCEIVACQKNVWKVIPNAPFPGIPLEFLKEHKIQIVAHGPEYAVEEDIYYKIPRNLKMTQVLPRTEGISTSNLISRIRSRDDLDSNKQYK